MAFDGMFTHAMVSELREKILNGRIMKISQPYPNEVILTIRSHRKNYPLLLSAHPNYARMQITQIPYKNPAVPTKFTMMLRKYLENAKLTAIQQLENDLHHVHIEAVLRHFWLWHFLKISDSKSSGFSAIG